ncbi:unnamed protein product [Nyctereutes procyonoides]|uniref:(raccoon dog) hypothetical protein n=1 Tax=Nyctereutes procyonoides TaxID=34880 RepID=A0A811XWQ2_NYCPR|nr:unnamed protein product [Nyctereutes procyonoides]
MQTSMLPQQQRHLCKDPVSIQMNVAELSTVTGRFSGQFKACAVGGAICGMVRQRTISSSWPRPMASFQRTPGWRE